MRVDEYLGYSFKTCVIVMRVRHESHDGRGSVLIRKECVMKMCSVTIILIMTVLVLKKGMWEGFSISNYSLYV